MPTEWANYEDNGYFCSLEPLEKEIQSFLHCSRTANLRLNVRELIAPMLFCKEAPITERALARMESEVALAESELAILAEKLLLLRTELSMHTRGGVA
ncbi:MAG: hypothetical protein J6J66_02855 [Clostridia bacterium]|nr:hypothetical protein [Clostridia bacterium]